jgi:hypothetical protein
MTTCTTLVCTNEVCAGCNIEESAPKNGCPTPEDSDSWYYCSDEGICVLNADTGISGGGIAGIIIGSVVFLGFVVGLTLYCCKQDP